jgi:hypothetical protein
LQKLFFRTLANDQLLEATLTGAPITLASLRIFFDQLLSDLASGVIGAALISSVQTFQAAKLVTTDLGRDSSQLPLSDNLYNASPIRAHVDMAKALSESPPEFVVSIRGQSRSMKFRTQCGCRYWLIRSCRTIYPTPKLGLLTRWYHAARADGYRSIFGAKSIEDTFDLEHIPEQSQSATLPDCSLQQDQFSSRFLMISMRLQATYAGHLEIPVRVGPENFRISFVRKPGLERYLIPLDRIWFWVTGEAKNFAPADSTVQTNIILKSLKNPILY